jgi:hypothetical protein
MPLPMVLNEICLELLVGVGILNVLVCFMECLDFIQISYWLHMGTHIIKEELQVQVLLILKS